MSITVNEFNEFIESLIPSSLKESYDNVGHLIGNNKDEITGVVACLDCSLSAIDKCIDLHYNMLLTHHPLIFIKPDSVITSNLQGKKIIKLIKNDVNHYAIHTNLDSISFGLNHLLVKLLGFSDDEIMERGVFENSGIGRIVSLGQGIKLKDLLKRVKHISKNIVKYTGDLEKVLHKVAIINGSGDDFIIKSIKLGADCIITGDTTYHKAKDAYEIGIAVIDMGHYESEDLPFKEFINFLNDKLKNNNVDLNFYYHQDGSVYNFY